MDKYFPEQENHVMYERCQYLDDGTRIGSVNCQCCLLCKESGFEGELVWIRCEVIDKAIGNKPINNNK